MEPTFSRAVGAAAMQGLATGTWVAAGELPARQRQLARIGSVLTISAVTGAVAARRAAKDPKAAAERYVEGELDRRQLAVAVASSALTIGLVVQRRRLEKRWLAALIRDGHPHPHRALALRMGLLVFAGSLPGRLIHRYAGRPKGL